MTMSAPDLLKDAEPQTFDERLTLIDKKLIWTDDGISIVCGFDEEEWSYYIIKGGAAITPKVTSKKPPYEVDPHNRDSKLKKSLSRVENRAGITTDAVMDILSDFGLYLMNAPEAIDSYMKSISDNATPEPSPANEELVAQAQDILKNGDPVKYIMDTFHTCHIGDDDYGRLLMLAIASQHVRNTHGIHLTPSGASGKGKSHAGRTMLHLVPRKYWISASLTAKALFYYDVHEGTIIFSDDVIMSEELISIMRRCITGFTEEQEHITVNKDREGVKMVMPARVIWIVAGIENFMDMQTRNRMIDVPVDETPETDELVFKKQVKDAVTGADEFPESDSVLICREIFHIIKSLKPVTVTIPYAPKIAWKIKSNRRNFDTFKELIKAFTVLRHLQRSKTDDGALIATIADFDDAKTIYLRKAEGENTKLTKRELSIIRVLGDYGEATVKTLQKALGVSQSTIQRIMKGKDGKTGLLDKVPTLMMEKRTDKIDDVTSVHREWYSVSHLNRLALYDDVVTLDITDEEKDSGDDA